MSMGRGTPPYLKLFHVVSQRLRSTAIRQSHHCHQLAGGDDSSTKSWKAKTVPKVELDYLYDATTDVHSFRLVLDSVIDDSDDSVRWTLVVKSVNGIVTIPINGPLVESQNIFEVHNTGTQTESPAFHGLQEEFEKIDDDHIIGQACRRRS